VAASSPALRTIPIFIPPGLFLFPSCSHTPTSNTGINATTVTTATPILSARIDEDSFHRLRELILDGQVSEKRLKRMEGLLEEREAQWAQSTKDREADMMVAMKKALKEKQAAEDMAERTKIAAEEAARALEKAAAEMMAEVEHAATEVREEARKAAIQIRDEAEVAAAVAESKGSSL
jgi:hypothetical protein